MYKAVHCCGDKKFKKVMKEQPRSWVRFHIFFFLWQIELHIYLNTLEKWSHNSKVSIRTSMKNKNERISKKIQLKCHKLESTLMIMKIVIFIVAWRKRRGKQDKCVFCAAERQRWVLLIDAWLASTEAVRAPAEAPYSLVAPFTRYGAFSRRQLATPMW